MATVTVPYQPRSYQATIHQEMDRVRFSVLVMHRRAGKTVNELIKRAAMCTLQRPRFSYIAPLYTQSKSICWDYLKYYTSVIPGIKRNESELFVELPNEARIKLFGSDNPDSLRGLYHDGVVLDEPADMKLGQVWGEVVRPALADRGGWAAFIGTPRGIDPFYDLYQHALADPLWYATLLTVDDTGALSPEELAQAKATMSEAQFLQEFYCDFTASSDDIFIPLSIVRPALGAHHSPDKYVGAPVILSYDIARFGDDEIVGFKRQGLVAQMIMALKGLDTMTLAGRIAQDIVEHDPDATFIDEGNMGAGVIDRLRQMGHKVIGVLAGSKPTRSPNIYSNKRAEMWGFMKQWLQDGGAIPNDQRLAAQLSGPTYTFDSADRIKLERSEDLKKRVLASPDRASALAQTFAHPVKKRVETNIAVQRASAALRQKRDTRQQYNVLEYR